MNIKRTIIRELDYVIESSAQMIAIGAPFGMTPESNDLAAAYALLIHRAEAMKAYFIYATMGLTRDPSLFSRLRLYILGFRLNKSMNYVATYHR